MFVHTFLSSVFSAGFGAPHRPVTGEFRAFRLRAVSRRTATALLRHATRLITRGALRVAYAGNPLTPTGYAILGMTVIAVVLVALLSTSSVSNELESALRVSWWFS
jgi:hypothetical protein